MKLQYILVATTFAISASSQDVVASRDLLAFDDVDESPNQQSTQTEPHVTSKSYDNYEQSTNLDASKTIPTSSTPGLSDSDNNYYQSSSIDNTAQTPVIKPASVRPKDGLVTSKSRDDSYSGIDEKVSSSSTSNSGSNLDNWSSNSEKGESFSTFGSSDSGSESIDWLPSAPDSQISSTFGSLDWTDVSSGFDYDDWLSSTSNSDSMDDLDGSDEFDSASSGYGSNDWNVELPSESDSGSADWDDLLSDSGSLDWDMFDDSGSFDWDNLFNNVGSHDEHTDDTKSDSRSLETAAPSANTLAPNNTEASDNSSASMEGIVNSNITTLDNPSQCPTGWWGHMTSWWKNTFGKGDECALKRRLR